MENTADVACAPTSNPLYDPEELEGLYALAQYQPPADLDLQLFGATDGSAIEMPFHETREYLISIAKSQSEMNGVTSLGEVQGGPVQYPQDIQPLEEDPSASTSPDTLPQDMQDNQYHVTENDATGLDEGNQIVESNGFEGVMNSAQDNQVEEDQSATSQQLRLEEETPANVTSYPIPSAAWELLPIEIQNEILLHPTLPEFGSDEYKTEFCRLTLRALPDTAFDKHPITSKIQFAQRLECDFYEFSSVLNADLAAREGIPYRALKAHGEASSDATWPGELAVMRQLLNERFRTQWTAYRDQNSTTVPCSFPNATGNAFKDFDNALITGILAGAMGMKQAIKNRICQELAANGNLGPLSLSTSSQEAREQVVQRVAAILDHIAPVDLAHAETISWHLQLNYYGNNPMQFWSTMAENWPLSEEDKRRDLAFLTATYGSPGKPSGALPQTAPQQSMKPLRQVIDNPRVAGEAQQGGGSQTQPSLQMNAQPMPPQLNSTVQSSTSYQPRVPVGYFGPMNNAVQAVVGSSQQLQPSLHQPNQIPVSFGQPVAMGQSSQVPEHNYSTTFQQQPAAPVANQQPLLSSSQHNAGSQTGCIGASFNQNVQQVAPFKPQENHRPMSRYQSASESHGHQQPITPQQSLAPAMEIQPSAATLQLPNQAPDAANDSNETWLLTGKTNTHQFGDREVVSYECNDGVMRILNEEQRSRAYRRAHDAQKAAVAAKRKSAIQANSMPIQYGVPVQRNNIPTTYANSTFMPSGMPVQPNNISSAQANSMYIQPGATIQPGNAYNTVTEALRRQPSQSPLNVRAPHAFSTNTNLNTPSSTPIQKNTQTQPKQSSKANRPADGQSSSKSHRKRKQLHGATEDEDESSKDST